MAIKDVITAYISFEEQPGGKTRPILILKIQDEIFFTLKITSKYNQNFPFVREYYYPIYFWKYVSLKRPSYIDTTRLIPVNPSILPHPYRYIGTLHDLDFINMIAFIKKQSRYQ